MQAAHQVRPRRQVTRFAVGLRQRNGGEARQHFRLDMFIGGPRPGFRAILYGSRCASIGLMCSERRILLSEYSETTRAYADSVRKFTDLAGLALGSDADLLRRNCRSTWEAAERARLALSRHEVKHGCDRPDFAGAAAAAASSR